MEIFYLYNSIPGRLIKLYIEIFYFYYITGTYLEHICCDPKDGELYLIRSKSGETLMEDRNSSDVQIDCQN